MFSLLYAQRNYYPLPERYHTYPEMIKEVKKVCREHPELAEWEIIGHSGYSLKPIYAVRVSNHVNRNLNNRPTLMIHGSSQGEEVIGIEICLALLNEVTDYYGVNPVLTELLDKFELWFVPSMNPEGYDMVSSGEFYLCRKNLTDSNFDGYLDVLRDGVDLNKNFDFNWIDFARPHPESIYFKGHAPATETEVLAMQDFFAREHFTYALNYHSSAAGSFSESIFFPWNDGEEKSPDYDHFLELGSVYVSHLPKDYLPGNYELHLGKNTMIGYLRHYMYAKQGTLAFDIETGGNTEEGYAVVRPGEDQLIKIINKHLLAFNSIAEDMLKKTVSIRVIDKLNKPLIDKEFQWFDYPSSYYTELKTNSAGYIFKYLPIGKTRLLIDDEYVFSIESNPAMLQTCKIPFEHIKKPMPEKKVKTILPKYTYCLYQSAINNFYLYSDSAIRMEFYAKDFNDKVIRFDSLKIATDSKSCNLRITLKNRNGDVIRTREVQKDNLDEQLVIPFAGNILEKAELELENLSDKTFTIKEERTYLSHDSEIQVKYKTWQNQETSDLDVELK